MRSSIDWSNNEIRILEKNLKHEKIRLKLEDNIGKSIIEIKN